MSALGQKQTFALHWGMSALPLKADMCSALTNVRFGPKADIRFSPERTGLQWRKSVAQWNVRNPHQTAKRLVQF
jgi:hypothetical protein